jgi:hypothetical protein
MIGLEVGGGTAAKKRSLATRRDRSATERTACLKLRLSRAPW